MEKDINLTYREIGSNAFVEIEICDYYDIYINETVSVNEFLKVAAEIIDKSSYYRDIFNSRIF